VERRLSPVSTIILRLAFASLWWIARYFYRGQSGAPPDPAVIPLDAVLAVLHLWALGPLQKLVGDRFGQMNSLSYPLAAPAAFALFLLIRDSWFVLKHIPL
jgi:hypothetical protein